MVVLLLWLELPESVDYVYLDALGNFSNLKLRRIQEQKVLLSPFLNHGVGYKKPNESRQTID